MAILKQRNFFFFFNVNHNVICKCSTATLNLITLTHTSFNILQKRQNHKGFRSFGYPDPTDKHLNSQQNGNNLQQVKRKTCDLLFSFRVPFYDVPYKETNKTPCHHIPNIIQYHMTLNLTNNIPLKLGFPPKLDQL